MVEEKSSRAKDDIVSKDPAVHSGNLVFTGTRVPARFLEALREIDRGTAVVVAHPGLGE